jgi:hypothetical protein
MNAYVVGHDTIDLLAAAALTLPDLGRGHPEPALTQSVQRHPG